MQDIEVGESWGLGSAGFPSAAFKGGWGPRALRRLPGTSGRHRQRRLVTGRCRRNSGHARGLVVPSTLSRISSISVAAGVHLAMASVIRAHVAHCATLRATEATRSPIGPYTSPAMSPTRDRSSARSSRSFRSPSSSGVTVAERSSTCRALTVRLERRSNRSWRASFIGIGRDGAIRAGRRGRRPSFASATRRRPDCRDYSPIRTKCSAICDRLSC